MSNLSGYVVRDGNGAVDLNATETKFRTDLQAYLTERAEQDTKIADAVSAVFDQFKGANINLPALETFVLAKLDAQPSNYGELSAALRSYIKDNSGEGGTFKIAKGKGGGCHRVCDEKPTTA